MASASNALSQTRLSLPVSTACYVQSSTTLDTQLQNLPLELFISIKSHTFNTIAPHTSDSFLLNYAAHNRLARRLSDDEGSC